MSDETQEILDRQIHALELKLEAVERESDNAQSLLISAQEQVANWEELANATRDANGVKYVPQSYVEMQETIDDYKDHYRRVLSEECSPVDEMHCSCVPALRLKIVGLETRIEGYKEQARKENTDASI